MDPQLPNNVAVESKSNMIFVSYSISIPLDTPRQCFNLGTGKTTQITIAEVGCGYTALDSATAQQNMLKDLKFAGYDTITKTFPNIK